MDEAVVEVTLRRLVESPPARVEVAVVVPVKYPAIDAQAVEVPSTESAYVGDVVAMPSLPSLANVEVAVPPNQAWFEENNVEEALPLNCWRAVQMFALPRLRLNEVPSYERPVPAVVVAPE